jgi:ATP-binding cassette subfamily B protein
MAILSTILAAGLNLVVPRIQMLLIDRISIIVTDTALSAIVRLALLMLGTILLREVFRGAANIIAHQAAWNLVEKVRVKVYAKMQTFTTEYFSSVHTGDLMSRVVSDTATLEQLYAHLIPDTIANIITFVGVSVIMFTINPGLAALTCIPIPLIIFLGWFYQKKIRPLSATAKNTSER